MTKKWKAAFRVLVIALLLVIPVACSKKEAKHAQKIYVAWSDSMDSYSFKSTLKTIEETGAEPVVLSQAKSAHQE